MRLRPAKQGWYHRHRHIEFLPFGVGFRLHHTISPVLSEAWTQEGASAGIPHTLLRGHEDDPTICTSYFLHAGSTLGYLEQQGRNLKCWVYFSLMADI